MNKKMVASLSMLLLPWLTVPFLGKSFFRFLPAATFVNLFITVLSVIANRKKWYIQESFIS
ncbi:hypothetical protein [Mesobacillus foraminis]|uniref:Uncharacterized protein n=1 Tax=Mesobacillus foraminis TaxID=279826 RepID=A0A4R2B2H1_9BACI|nr:hypothetical protein [Mesobacillus foraminis]TCN20423.1 hypothetical protein EV146_11440 [Mesobacillus foraminis]